MFATLPPPSLTYSRSGRTISQLPEVLWVRLPPLTPQLPLSQFLMPHCPLLLLLALPSTPQQSL